MRLVIVGLRLHVIAMEIKETGVSLGRRSPHVAPADGYLPLHAAAAGLPCPCENFRPRPNCLQKPAQFSILVEYTLGYYTVSQKSEPLNISQQPPQTCTDLNEILHTQDDIYFCHLRQIS